MNDSKNTKSINSPKSKSKSVSKSVKKIKHAKSARLNRRGAKDKYKDWISQDGITRLSGWARSGYTDEDIAKMMGIAPSTLYSWKNRYQEIKEALRCAKEIVDFQVEQALLKRALGYFYDEVTSESKLNQQTGESVMVVTKKVTKEVVADTTAQIFWLKNRKPDVWREKQEVVQEVEVKPSSANDSILESLSKRKVEE